MTPDEILRKHEDANEMHFHEVDRKWIIEAMEEYAVNLLTSKTVDYHNSSNICDKEKSEKPINLTSSQTEISDEEIEELKNFIRLKCITPPRGIYNPGELTADDFERMAQKMNEQQGNTQWRGI